MALTKRELLLRDLANDTVKGELLTLLATIDGIVEKKSFTFVGDEAGEDIAVTGLASTDVIAFALAIPHIRHEDLRFPASEINPVGLASPPDRDTNDGTLLFAANELVAFHPQFPHKWVVGTPVEVHVHWQKSAAGTGTVIWKVEYDWANIFGDFAGNFDANVTTTDDVPASTATHHLTDLGDIDGTGKTASSMMKARLVRTGGTYASDAKLLEVDFHIQLYGAGSIEEYTSSPIGGVDGPADVTDSLTIVDANTIRSSIDLTGYKVFLHVRRYVDA